MWYSFGDDWINLYLPHYVQMDHKPGAGFEIQDTSCVRSMVVMKLKLVNSNTEDESYVASNGNAPSGKLKF